MSLVQIVICPSRLDSGRLILKREEEVMSDDDDEAEGEDVEEDMVWVSTIEGQEQHVELKCV